MKLKETPTNGRKKLSYSKLRSPIENIIRPIIKINEGNKIYNSCSVETNDCDKNNIVYSIEC